MTRVTRLILDAAHRGPSCIYAAPDTEIGNKLSDSHLRVISSHIESDNPRLFFDYQWRTSPALALGVVLVADSETFELRTVSVQCAYAATAGHGDA